MVGENEKGSRVRHCSPSPQVMEAMRYEHCAEADSQIPFTTPNYSVLTTSETEWLFGATRPRIEHGPSPCRDLRLIERPAFDPRCTSGLAG